MNSLKLGSILRSLISISFVIFFLQIPFLKWESACGERVLTCYHNPYDTRQMYSKQDVSQYSGFSGPEGPPPMKTPSNPDKIQHHYQLKGVGREINEP